MEEMQNKAVVFFVFYLWSTIEIVRWGDTRLLERLYLSGAAFSLREWLSWLQPHLVWHSDRMCAEFWLHQCALQKLRQIVFKAATESG